MSPFDIVAEGTREAVDLETHTLHLSCDEEGWTLAFDAVPRSLRQRFPGPTVPDALYHLSQRVLPPGAAVWLNATHGIVLDTSPSKVLRSTLLLIAIRATLVMGLAMAAWTLLEG